MIYAPKPDFDERCMAEIKQIEVMLQKCVIPPQWLPTPELADEYYEERQMARDTVDWLHRQR